MKIAILGWGSLIWDGRAEFDQWREEWSFDGPQLNLEFSRISAKTRKGALTLAVDDTNGEPCRVAYTMSKRRDADEAISDLRMREGTILRRIGYHFADGSRKREPDVPESIMSWTLEERLDVVIWTGLPSNFHDETGSEFSVPGAVSYLRSLRPEGQIMAAEYVRRAPDLIDTPLRRALEAEDWFGSIPAPRSE